MSIEDEATRLEAMAADLRCQAAVEVLKDTHCNSRKEANHAIQVHHGSLPVPKQLKAENNDCGNRVTLRCKDERCPVVISSRRALKLFLSRPSRPS